MQKLRCASRLAELRGVESVVVEKALILTDLCRSLMDWSLMIVTWPQTSKALATWLVRACRVWKCVLAGSRSEGFVRSMVKWVGGK